MKEIKEAIKLLEQNGYVVTKYTERMEEDAEKCANGECEMLCEDCSCHVCMCGNY